MKVIYVIGIVLCLAGTRAKAGGKCKESPVGLRKVCDLQDPFIDGMCNALHKMSVLATTKGGFVADVADDVGVCADSFLRKRYRRRAFLCKGEMDMKVFFQKLAEQVGAQDAATFNTVALRSFCLLKMLDI